MERVPTHYKRRYHHDCPVSRTEKQIALEICPDCGQKGTFAGFFQGIFTRIGRQSRLLGFPAFGGHMRFLPQLTRSCERCRGEGIAPGEDFDYECPDCSGTGGILIRSEEEMRKVRRWALNRHQRSIAERDRPQAGRRPSLSGNPIHTRDAKTFVSGVMALFKYDKNFRERDWRIGELMLACDDHGWDVFMELIEVWDGWSGGLGAGQDTVELRPSHHKNAAAWLSLHPPLEVRPQGLRIHRTVLRRRLGRQAEALLWQQLARFAPAADGWIPVDEALTVADALAIIDTIRMVREATPPRCHAPNAKS